MDTAGAEANAGRCPLRPGRRRGGLQGRPADPQPRGLCQDRRCARCRRGILRQCDAGLQYDQLDGATDAECAAVLCPVRAGGDYAERIRDKVAASKARGMWMGGSLPLGYTAIDKKLVPVPARSRRRSCKIMELYLKSANVLDLADRLRLQGIVSKQRLGRDGAAQGRSCPSRAGRCIIPALQPDLCRGGRASQGKIYPGEHEGHRRSQTVRCGPGALRVVADQRLRSSPVKRGTVSLLAGMIHDGISAGRCRRSTRATMASATATMLPTGEMAPEEPALRLPAGGLDHAIRTALQSFLADAHRISKLDVDPVCHADLISSFGALAPSVDGMAIAERHPRGEPCWARTSDLDIKSHLALPTELRVQPRTGDREGLAPGQAG
jgi:hypothetical protein